jgi:hypothetical protein
VGSPAPAHNSMAIIPLLDRFVFIKKGYSFWKHLIPFCMAALVLVVLSLPADNLLLKLTDRLSKPDWIWIPAIALTILACLIYGSFVYVQARQAYLWTDGSLRRGLLTASLYLLACAAMAYAVLQTGLTAPALWGGVWACVLVAALSLTGVGWSLPDSWVKSIGIQVPDYTEARTIARQLAKLVAAVAAKPYAARGDVEAFLKVAGSLRDQIEVNKSLEPEWAMPQVDCAVDDVRELMEQAASDFLPEKDAPNSRQAVEEFSLACAFESGESHRGFTAALRRVSDYWLDWKFATRR